VQSNQALHDRKAQARTIVTPVVGCVGLEKWLAKMRKITLPYADACIFDR
jgi:hypothetical protein